jgi:hypothetical protein
VNNPNLNDKEADGGKWQRNVKLKEKLLNELISDKVQYNRYIRTYPQARDLFGGEHSLDELFSSYQKLTKQPHRLAGRYGPGGTNPSGPVAKRTRSAEDIKLHSRLRGSSPKERFDLIVREVWNAAKDDLLSRRDYRGQDYAAFRNYVVAAANTQQAVAIGEKGLKRWEELSKKYEIEFPEE